MVDTPSTLSELSSFHSAPACLVDRWAEPVPDPPDALSRSNSAPDISSRSSRRRARSTARLGHALVRNTSNAIQSLLGVKLAAPYQATFLCAICFENVPKSKQRVLEACAKPSHAICKPCARAYFVSRIETGRVLELQCPSCPREQPAMASEAEVKEILAGSPAALARYERLCALKGDSSLRECPGCHKICAPERLDNGAVNPQMRCGDCELEFCYYHSLAHKDGDCATYEGKLAKETKAHASDFGFKECPGCNYVTEKVGGCNHMTCCACRCDWCWVCGEVIEGGEAGVFEHYDNPLSRCRQFPEDYISDIDTISGWSGLGRDSSDVLRLVTFPVRFIGATWMLGVMVISHPVLLLLEFMIGTFAFCCWCCLCGCMAKPKQILQVCVSVNLLIAILIIFLGLPFLWLVWVPLACLFYPLCAYKSRHSPNYIMRELLIAPFRGGQFGFWRFLGHLFVRLR